MNFFQGESKYPNIPYEHSFLLVPECVRLVPVHQAPAFDRQTYPMTSQPCQVCQNPVSKYPCPACKAPRYGVLYYALRCFHYSYFPSCSLPCFKSHKNQCALLDPQAQDKDSARTIGTPGSAENPESVTVMDPLQDQQILELFEKFPTLRPRLKCIFDASKERPEIRQGSRHDKSRHSNKDTFKSSQLSPERRLANAMRLLDKELNAASAESIGIEAFSSLVGQVSAEDRDSI